MHKPFDYARNIGALSTEQKLWFYERFAHDLTVAVRFVWSDSETTDAEKVEQMKWINEIMHHVVAKTSHLRLNLEDWPEEALWFRIKSCVQQCPSIKSHVLSPLLNSYNSVVQQQDQVAPSPPPDLAGPGFLRARTS